MNKNRDTLIEFCKKNNIDVEFLILDDTSTSEKASKESGLPPEKIGKTIVFIDDENTPLAILVRSIYKISQNKLAKLLGKKHIRLAKPEEVIKYTGYVPGGIAPLDLQIKLILDKELINEKYIWVGGGDQRTLMKIKIEDIIKFQNPEIIDVPKKID